MHKVFLESPVCLAALGAGDTIEDFGRVFAEKFDSITCEDIAFFSRQYELFNNRVLHMINFIGFNDEQFLFSLADTMNQMPDEVFHRQINPYFNFTADLLENSCVFKRNKCSLIMSHDNGYCNHSWCVKFYDVTNVIREATRTGRTLKRVIKIGVFNSDSIDFNEYPITVHPTLYTDEEIRAARGDDSVEMNARNHVQFMLECYGEPRIALYNDNVLISKRCGTSDHSHQFKGSRAISETSEVSYISTQHDR